MARRRRNRYRYEWIYPSTSPRRVRGGIKAQSKRGSFGKNWWAKRWIEALERFSNASRLSRGRSYARRGQVIGIEIERGEVNATVQGSRATPYSVEIVVETLDEEAAERLADVLRRKTALTGRLLAGEMPAEIEEVFQEAGLSLFPQRSADIETVCSCPDWANPCKHIAAVFYLIGEAFDHDPFLMLKLRGIDPERFRALLGEGAPIEGEAADEVFPPQPLPEDPGDFWGEAPAFHIPITLPPVDAALPKRLGTFPFWRGTEDFLETLETVYRAASTRCLEIVDAPQETKGKGKRASRRNASLSDE